MDGFRGRGWVTKKEGRRVQIKFPNSLYISRDQMYVHRIGQGSKGMWPNSLGEKREGPFA